jgi:hypothetical protein
MLGPDRFMAVASKQMNFRMVQSRAADRTNAFYDALYAAALRALSSSNRWRRIKPSAPA